MSTLAEEYPKQQARCRELLGQYQEIGAPGMFGAAIIEEILHRADVAAASGDIGAMVVAYTEMNGCQ